MVGDLWNREEYSLDIQLDKTTALRLDWTQTQLGRVLILENSGVAVYFCDGVIYLENGKGYDFSETTDQIALLMGAPWKLYPLVKTSREGEIWTAQMEEPSLVVTLEQGDSGFGAARIIYDGMEMDVLSRPDRQAVSVPEAVLGAIASGKTQGGGDLTKALLRLFAAGVNLSSRDTLAVELDLKADCGPLALADTLQIYSDRETGISYMEKNGKGLYFTAKGICSADGILLTGQEATVESAKLLGAAYLLLLNGDFTVAQDTYTLSLDQKGMENFAYTIAPAAKDLNIAFESGEILLKLKENSIENLSVSCAGTLDLLLTKLSVSIGGEMTVKASGDFTIPQSVLDTLS